MKKLSGYYFLKILFLILINIPVSTVHSQEIISKYKREFYGMNIDKDTIWAGGYTYLFKTDIKGNVLKKYSTKDGLPQGPYLFIAIDKNGDKWIATKNGFSVFNGRTFTNYDSLNNESLDSITALAIDSLGNKWIGTSNKGVWKYDGNEWVNYNNSNYLHTNNITVITAGRNDTVWVGTENFDVYLFTKYEHMHLILPKSNDYYYKINSIAFDKLGNTWFSIQYELNTSTNIVKFNGENFSIFTYISPLFSIYIDLKGTLIYYDRYQTLIHPEQSNTFGLSISHYKQLLSDHNGRLWILGDDLYYTDNYQAVTRVYLDDIQLSSNSVNCMTIDKKGDKWFGTKEHGACKLDSSGWKVYSTTDGIPDNHIRDIKVDKNNNIWIATDKGAAKFDGQKWTTFNNEPVFGNKPYWVNSIAIDSSGKVWLSESGPVSYDGTQWKKYDPFNLSNYDIISIDVDTKGVVWFGTTNGVFSFDGTSWQLYNQANSGLSSNWIKSIAIDANNNNKWFATQSGVIKFDGENWITIPYKGTTNLDTDIENKLTVDNNSNLWIYNQPGNYYNLKYTGEEWTNFVIPHNNILTTCYVDKQYNKWLCTYEGGVFFLDNKCNLPDSAGVDGLKEAICEGEKVEFTVNIKDYSKSFCLKWNILNIDSLVTGPFYNWVSLDIPLEAKSGTIKVQKINLCGKGPVSTKEITVKKKPKIITNLEGLNKVCAGDTNILYTYKKDSISTYSWSYGRNSGSCGKSDTLFMNFPDTFHSDYLKIKGSNDCGTGPETSYYIKVIPNKPIVDGILGSTLICSDKRNLLYSVIGDTSDVMNYKWHLPDGVYGSSDSCNINLEFGSSFKSGVIKLETANACGSIESQLEVKNSEMKTPEIVKKWNDLIICKDSSKIYTNINWFFNNIKQNNLKDLRYFKVKSDGLYKVVVSNIDGCTDSSEFNFNLLANQSLVSPNPFQNSITISLYNTESGEALINLVNLKGTVIKQYKYDLIEPNTAVEFDTRDIPEGFYLLNLKVNNKDIHTTRVLKN